MMAIGYLWKTGMRGEVNFLAWLSPESRARRLPAFGSLRVASLIQNTALRLRESLSVFQGDSLLLRPAACLLLLGAVLPAAGCGGKVDLESQWRTKSVYVDGANTEWSGATTYFDDQKLSVGLQNDGEYLYVALFVGDRRSQAQIVMQGCTLWFDPSGEGEKELGVRYPLGFTGRGGEAGARGPKSGGERGQGPWGSPPDSETLEEILSKQPKTVEILGPGPGQLHSQSLVENDMEVIVLVHETSLVYEIKIPLTRGGHCPFGVGAEPGMEIAVGVETPEIQTPERPQGMGRGRPGGLGGGRGGMGGRPGGMGGRSGGRPEPPSPLEVWAKVKLAAAPNAD
jgi:hypothetical protein